MKCYTSNIKLDTDDFNEILANARHKEKLIFLNSIRAALYNIDEWLADHQRIFYDAKQNDLVCKAIGNNIDPKKLEQEIQKKYQDFFQANSNLWQQVVLPIRNVLSEIIRDYVGIDKHKDTLMGDYIHYLSTRIMGALIREEREQKERRQQYQTSWQQKENIVSSSKTTFKPENRISWAEEVKKISSREISKADLKSPEK